MQASLSSPASFVEYTVRNKRESGELLAVCCNKLFGKTWDGELVLLQEVKASNPQLQVIRVIKTRGGNTSVAWLGEKEEILASAADDGGIYLWNTVNTKKEKPMRVLMEHDDVISSLAVNTMDLNSLLSASWDLRLLHCVACFLCSLFSIKLWPVKSQVSSRSYYGHEALIHEVEWKRGSPNEFASVSNDGNIRIWDQRVDRSTSSFYVPVACPLYSLSWNHFNHNILATGTLHPL
jgi:WD40 repeat protein